MFERFTERARHVVVLAQDEARELQHNYLGTEHLLLGLLREEEGIAARALRELVAPRSEAAYAGSSLAAQRGDAGRRDPERLGDLGSIDSRG